MKLIGLNADSKQEYTLVLPDGSTVDFKLEYVPNQAGWFYSVTYRDWSSVNRRLVVSQNMLRQFREIIPFGLACFSTDIYEPLYQDDIATGRITVCQLDQADVLEAEVLIGA